MDHSPRDELDVSPLELFFDLVFAFTTTQLTTLLTTGLAAAVPQVALILVTLFWMYAGYVWLTNQVPRGGPDQRIALLSGMGGFLICALATPRAFAGDGVVFGFGWLLIVLVHTLLYAKALGQDARLFAPFNVIGAVLLIVAGMLDLLAAYSLFVLAIVLQSIAARKASQIARRRDFHIHPAHFVERNGALLLIAIGESIIATGIGLEGTHLDAKIVIAALLGFALSAALWWLHFDVDERLGVLAMRSATPLGALRIALGGYFYAYLVLLFGIIVTASGVRLSIAHFAEPDVPEGAILLSAGVGIYLLGDVVYRLFVGVRPVWTRIIAALAAVLTIPLGVAVATGAQLVALLVVVVGVLSIEGARMHTRLVQAPAG